MFGKHASLGDFLTRRQRKKARFHAPLGWGTWIRTRDAGTKTRCLTAWLYPNIIGMIARDQAVVNLLPEIDADTF